jgi:hypothetical protein
MHYEPVSHRNRKTGRVEVSHRTAVRNMLIVCDVSLPVMTTYRRITLGSELGSAAIEERLTEIALLMRQTFPEYCWEHKRDGNDARLHRLHVYLDGHEAPVNFTYRELLMYSRLRRRCAIDRRMYNVLKSLFEQ